MNYPIETFPMAFVANAKDMSLQQPHIEDAVDVKMRAISREVFLLDGDIRKAQQIYIDRART
jgi:hypothetical protein